jgi:hypothetical protein
MLRDNKIKHIKPQYRILRKSHPNFSGVKSKELRPHYGQFFDFVINSHSKFFIRNSEPKNLQ